MASGRPSPAASPTCASSQVPEGRGPACSLGSTPGAGLPGRWQAVEAGHVPLVCCPALSVLPWCPASALCWDHFFESQGSPLRNALLALPCTDQKVEAAGAPPFLMGWSEAQSRQRPPPLSPPPKPTLLPASGEVMDTDL